MSKLGQVVKNYVLEITRSASQHNCSLYRITKLSSRIKYGNRGIFYRMTFSVVDHFFNNKKPDFFRTKLIWVGARSGLGLGLEYVSKVVFPQHVD